ncbi:MAG: M23 family metallopeptidase, partial [Dysosmobacter sp.]|nr:M23 family metallopeptidase [Dysosmobacter sp.]
SRGLGAVYTIQPWTGYKTDRELHAQSSAESAAQWKELLVPYEPFGLKWTFDDPDLDGNGLSMTFEGREVSGIYDEKQGLWITEHTGNGAYGPGAVELYTVYEDGRLTGLRLATEEEQAQFTQDRKLSSDSLKVETLAESVRYDDGHIYFTIPESGEPWSIFIRGRVLMEDGSGMSVHYLEEESEKAEWVPRMTYSFEVGGAAFDELTMEIAYGDASYSYPLTLILPEGKPLEVEPLPEGKMGIPEGTEMIWPVDGGRITNSFGERAKPGGEEAVMHNGVDIGGMAEGAPVYAAGKGTVKEAGFSAANGNYVRLDHRNGLETFYAHCRSLLVKAGDAVELGQTIASVGSSGMATGPHLHFEVSQNGVLQNPEIFYQMNEAPAAPSQDQPGTAEPSTAAPMDPKGAEPSGMAEQRAQLINGDYPRNSRGETYGNAFGYRLTGYDPDLLAAVDRETGVRGYIAREDRDIGSGSMEEVAA